MNRKKLLKIDIERWFVIIGGKKKERDRYIQADRQTVDRQTQTATERRKYTKGSLLV